MLYRGYPDKRYLCSDLVEIECLDRTGQEASTIGNLEEIWASGASLLVETPIPRGTQVTFHCRHVPFRAHVTTCTRDFLGYFVEVRFEEGFRWSRRKLRPRHLFDPHSLVRQVHREPAA